MRLSAHIPNDLICRLPEGGLRQALLNLVLNAAQSMEDRGGKIEILAAREGQTVALSVVDTGPGFPPEMLMVGVRPFASGRIGGTGLGLAMVRRFAEDINAELELTDMSLPDGNALDLLEKVRGRGLPGEWVFLTAYGSVPDSVRALKLGAYDFLEKPSEPERLALILAGAARSTRAQRRLRDEAQNRGSRYTPAAFVGHSPAGRQAREMLERLSRVPLSVLVITGETGTGQAGEEDPRSRVEPPRRL